MGSYFFSARIYAARKSPDGELFAIDESGKELFSFPTGTICVSKYHDTLLAAAKLVGGKNEKEQRTTLLNVRGEILREFVGCTFQEKFDLHSTMATLDSGWLQGVLDKNGIWILQPEYNELKIAEPDRIVCTSANDDFDSEEWASYSSGFVRNRDRKKQFAKFLQKYDLIGMERARVYELLGVQDTVNAHDATVHYGLQYGGCGLGAPLLDIKFDSSEKVCGWRIGANCSTPGIDDKWVMTNVICIVPVPGQKFSLQMVEPKDKDRDVQH